MNIELFGLIIDLVSALAVLATLIYLSKQIKQSNKLAKSQVRQSMSEHGQAELYQLSGDWELANILFFKESPLSLEQRSKLNFFLTSAMRQRELEWHQYLDGIISEDVYKAYHGVITIHLGQQKTRDWWNKVGKLAFDSKFVTEVDALLEATPLISGFEGLKTLEI